MNLVKVISKIAILALIIATQGTSAAQEGDSGWIYLDIPRETFFPNSPITVTLTNASDETEIFTLSASKGRVWFKISSELFHEGEEFDLTARGKSADNCNSGQGKFHGISMANGMVVTNMEWRYTKRACLGPAVDLIKKPQ